MAGSRLRCSNTTLLTIPPNPEAMPIRTTPDSPFWAWRAASIACPACTTSFLASSRNICPGFVSATLLLFRKEGHAQIFLELADLTAQRRLRDVQLLRRLAEVQVFRDSDKVANVPKFHGALFYTR